MRKIVMSFCILLAVVSLKAQPVSGIRIDGGNTPILVYLEGKQMSLPATSCFIANLKRGDYKVEVYATRSTRPGERVWKGKKLYGERIYFSGNGVKDIFVEDRSNGNVRPGRPGHDDRRSYRVMSDPLFKTFYNKMKSESFSKNRLKMIEAALVNSDFTSAQGAKLVRLFDFDKDRMEAMKMMYPQVVDKESFFLVIDVLTYSSSKEKMNEFVKNYGRR